MGFLGNTGQHLLFYDTDHARRGRPGVDPAVRGPDSLDQGQHPRRLAGRRAGRGRDRRAPVEVRHQPAAQGRAPRPARAQAAARHEAHGVRPLRRVRRHGPPRPRRGARGRHLRPAHRRPPAGSSFPPPAGTSPCHPAEDLFYALSFRVAAAGRPRLARVGDGLLQGVRLRDRRRERRGHCGTGRPGGRRRRTSTPTSAISDTRAHLLHRRQQHHRDDRPGELRHVRVVDERPDAARAAPRRAQPPRPGARRVHPRLTGHQQPALPQRPAGHPRLTARLGLRLPALRRPDPAVHRQPRAQHASPSTTTRRTRSGCGCGCRTCRSTTTALSPWADPRLGFHHSH